MRIRGTLHMWLGLLVLIAVLPTTPCTAQEKATPVAAEEQATSEVSDEQATPEVAAEETTTPAVEEQNPYPLKGVDTSSPQATLRSFIESCNKAYDVIAKQGGKYRRHYRSESSAVPALRCLDLSEVPPTLKESISGRSAVCLKEVLDRIDVPDEWEVPSAEDVEGTEEKPGITSWTIPHTEIKIAKVAEGERQGEFLFCPDTVARAHEFYRKVEHLPYNPGASKGFYDWYLSEPGWMIPTTWIRSLPKWTRNFVFGQTVWQWIALLITLSLGIFAMFLTYRVGRRLARIGLRSNMLKYCLSLSFPIAAMLIPLFVKYFVTVQLNISGPMYAILVIVLDVIFLIGLIVVVVGVGNRIAEVIISAPRIHPKGIDAQLIRLTSRVTSIVVAVFILLEGGRNLGIPLTTLLAGAGVGGLTVALAAQDTLRNLFGSMMIILDRPFRVGERIVTKGYDGVVEEIGLRSTKIRLLTGHLATIPNEEMARTDVENIGRRPHIRRIQDIALPYDTPLEKVDKSLEIVRGLLEDHEGMEADFPPRVYFTQFNRDCLNLRIIYWYHPPDYWDFLAHSEKLNTEIMRRFEAEEIRFAMPTTTTRMTAEEEGPLRVTLAGEIPPDLPSKQGDK